MEHLEPRQYLLGRGEPMIRGRLFRLSSATLAIRDVDGRRQALTVPAGSVVRVLNEGTGMPNAMVSVSLDGKTVMMFAEDIRSRGDELDEMERLA